MTNTLTNIKLANGRELLVEVEEPDLLVGVKAVGLGSDGAIDFAAALDEIKRAAAQVLDALQSIAVPPNSCEIQFGIKLSGTVGVILAKASTEANFAVKMTWSKKE